MPFTLAWLLGVRLLAALAPTPPDEPPRALAAPAPESSRADEALLAPLLELVDPDDPGRCAVAAGALAKEADPRAVAPLRYVLQDPTRSVRKAAAEALGAFRDPRAEAALRAVAQRSDEAVEVRAAAIAALARQASPSAGDALYALYVDSDQPGPVREAARAALTTSFPQILASRPPPAPAPQLAGRLILSVAGAGFGAFTLGTVGAFGQSDAGVPIGILGGLGVGAAAGFLVGRESRVDRALYLTSGLAWGTWNGLALAQVVLPDTQAHWYAGMGVLGEGAGLALTAFTWPRAGYETGDVALLDLAGLTGSALCLGALQWVPPTGNLRPAWGLTLLSGDLAIAGMAPLARHLRFEHGDAALAALGLATGAWQGGWLGEIFDSSAAESRGVDRPLGGFLLGSGLGLVLGAAAAQFTDFSSADVLTMGLAETYGYFVGAGLPLMVAPSASGHAIEATHLALGAAALGASAALAPRLHFDPGGVAMIGLGTAWGLGQGLGLGAFLSAPDVGAYTGSQSVGLGLLGVGVGGLAGMGLAQVLPVGALQVAMVASGGFWGAWLAIWSALYADASGSRMALATVLAGDGGLALAGLLVSPWMGAPPLAIGLANLLGVAGAAAFSLGAALTTQDGHAIILANLVGSGLGLAGGALIGTLLAPREASAGRADSALPLPAPLRDIAFEGAAPAIFTAPGGTRMDGYGLVARFH